jgi:hypothetical protein
MEYIQGADDEQRIRKHILGYTERNNGMPEFLMLPEVRVVAETLVAEGILTRVKESRRNSSRGWSYTRYIRDGGG